MKFVMNCSDYLCIFTSLQNRYYQEVEEEPEPEWMEFGPTDRFDVIELKGFDKDELEREGDKKIRLCNTRNVVHCKSKC